MTTKEDNRLSTEERILLAAEQEFLDKGLSGARTTTIADKAGVTHAMLHYYFRTKDNLFRQIISRKISRLKGLMLAPLLDGDVPLRQKIRHTIETHLDFLADNPDLPRFLISVMQNDPAMKEYFRQHVEESGNRMAEILQRQIDDEALLGKCRKLDAKMLILDILSLNVFSFVGAPLIGSLLGEFKPDSEFIRLRKENNVTTILNKLNL